MRSRGSPVLAAAVVAAAALVAVLAAGAVTGSPTAEARRPAAGEWVAGDLHVHTTYSHDAWGGPDDDNTGPDEFWTLGHSVENQFRLAAARGLDFLAITDHNDIRSQSPDAGFGSHGVMGVRGYENSLHGHAQMLGAGRVYDNGDASVAAVRAVADALRADGGVFQVNHPAGESVDFPHDADWGYGFDVVPDTIEVWNIHQAWQAPLPSGNSNDDAVRYWEDWLDLGYHVAATGGSDNHWVSTTAVQGVGQPTTWVFVTDRTEAGILEGLRRGRTFISHQPPGHAGPRLFLEGRSLAGGGWRAMVGDTVPAQSHLRVRVTGAPGSLLRIVTDGGAQVGDLIPVSGTSFTHRFVAPPGSTWVRAEIVEPDGADARRTACDPVVGDQTTYCRNSLGRLAMTSAIHLAP
jgi:hypothetical protein